MTRLFLAWLTVAAMCILLVFKINLTSDLLFLDSVATDLFYHGGAWSNWKLTPAAAYMPDMLAYALAYFTFPNPVHRIIFVCVVQALLLAWSCLHLARAIKPSLSNNAKVCVLLVTAAVVLVAANSSMWLFFNSTNNHFAALVFPLVCLAWALSFLKEKGLPKLLLIACGVAIGTASTSIFTLAFTVPALLFLIGCAVFFRAHHSFRRSAFQVGGAILVGQLIAILLQKILLSHNALAGRSLFNVEAALRSITAFVSATRLTFSTDNIYTLLLSLFLVVGIAWVIVDWIRGVRPSSESSPEESSSDGLKVSGKNSAYSLSVVFLLVALPINVLGAVLSGGFADPWGYRYFAFPIALGALLWIVMLDFKPAFVSRWAGSVVLLPMLAVVTLGLLTLKPLLAQTGRTGYADVFKQGAAGPGDAIAGCINLEAKKGFAFGAGIGDFWNARGVAHKTGKPLYILPTINDAMPFFHMMSLGPLINPHQYGFRSYNFVLMRKSGTVAQFDFTPETVGRQLPPPARVVNCENTDSELWLYTDLALDAVVKNKVNLFLGQQGLLRDYLKAAHELPGQVGKVESLSRVAQAGKDATGYLSYGPYIKVPPGRYQVSISYSATEAGNKWDAGRFNNPQKSDILASGDVPPGSGELKFSFETKESVSDFEIRTWFDGRGVFTVHKIRLQAASAP